MEPLHRCGGPPLLSGEVRACRKNTGTMEKYGAAAFARKIPISPERGFGAPGKLSGGQFSAENGRQPRMGDRPQAVERFFAGLFSVAEFMPLQGDFASADATSLSLR